MKSFFLNGNTIEIHRNSVKFKFPISLFSSNLPAPINEGPDPQTKEGNLIIEGVLRLGRFATDPSGVEVEVDGALYFNTAEKKIQVYSSDTDWADLGGSGAELGQLPTYTSAERDALSPSTGLMIYNIDYDQVQTFTGIAWSGITGNKDLGIECYSSMDCASGFCVDSVCCDTSLDNCNSDCEACNLAGTIGYCTVRANLDNTEVVSTCWYCNGTSDTSLAYLGYTGVNCTGSHACFSGTCFDSYCDEDNDGHFTTSVAQCPSNRFQSTAGDDCDDDCNTCYPGSTATTTTPDGKDQDCDGTIDDYLTTTVGGRLTNTGTFGCHLCPGDYPRCIGYTSSSYKCYSSGAFGSCTNTCGTNYH